MGCARHPHFNCTSSSVNPRVIGRRNCNGLQDRIGVTGVRQLLTTNVWSPRSRRLIPHPEKVCSPEEMLTGTIHGKGTAGRNDIVGQWWWWCDFLLTLPAILTSNRSIERS